LFLEDMDNLISKSHLFKKSVILAQGWMVYESGLPEKDKDSQLLSNYAMSVLMLYVFNYFHESLHHPLQALARFFWVYSNFPWDGSCASLQGPREVSCLTKPPKKPSYDAGAESLIINNMLRKYSSGATDIANCDEVDDTQIEVSEEKILQFKVRRTLRAIAPLRYVYNCCCGL